MGSDDVGVLQSAAECLRSFLRAGGEDALAWGADGNGGGAAPVEPLGVDRACLVFRYLLGRCRLNPG